ncbi:release factor glutamine methyltransferase [Streptomyces sp. Amel2xB2]|nr:release factor glutamine methyltransferase [Streptomyces sp. Amel2xB2]
MSAVPPYRPQQRSTPPECSSALSLPPMPAAPPEPPSLSRDALVAQLRDAGCVFAEDEAALLLAAARDPAELSAMAGRRAAGLPLEHVLGWAEFCGLRIVVEPGVFVPRRRSELLVRQAASVTRPGALVVDLCCGSGALGAALAAMVASRTQEDGEPGGARLPGGRIELHAADLDGAAVRCARRNVAEAGGRVHEGDLFDALPAGLLGRVAVLLANVPYVPTSSLGLLPAEARVHEPRRALDGGDDGLGVLRRVTAEAPRWLAPGGRLLTETSEAQADAAAAVMENDGLAVRIDRCEESGATVLTGTRPAAGTRQAPEA